MSDRICLCVFACAATVMMNPKCKPTAPTAGFPQSTALGWLVCVCVCVCVCVYREQLFSTATWGGQGETRTSYSCGPRACGNCGLNNVGEERRGEEARDGMREETEEIHNFTS